MNNVILDKKLFDYNSEKGPFVVVPKLFLTNLLKSQKTQTTGWKITKKSIEKRTSDALKEYKKGKTTNWRDLNLG